MWVHRLGVDSALILPLMGGGAKRFVLVLGRGAEAPRFSQAEMGMAAMFAGTVALALELSQSQILRNQVALVAERDRIARDLHDHVIQRLYAIGLTMQSVIATTPEAEGERLLRSLDEIDETIKQIRATIFRLTTPILSAAASLRARAEELVEELVPALGFRPALEFTGPVDFSVDPEIVDDCVAVLREAITNVARHAEASDAAVEVTGDRRRHPPAHRRQRARAGRLDPAQRHREPARAGRGTRRVHAGEHRAGRGHVAALVRPAAPDA